MYSPTKRPLAGLLPVVVLLASACADDGSDTEAPINPVNIPDTGAITTPPVDSAVPVDTGTPMVTPPRDAGGNRPMDAGMPNVTPVVDTGVPPVGDSGPAADGATSPEAGSVGGDGGTGTCCPDGKCLCHGDVPKALTSDRGPFKTQSYTVSAGCVYYPTDAQPPFAAVAISDGLSGAGGCGSFQTGQWGPLYASWGIVAMIVNTGSQDQPPARGMALTRGIAAFKTENTRSGSPLMGKLAGRYSTSGFSMGGGGTSYAAADDDTLLTNVMLMAWGPTRDAVKVPTLVVCGSSDNIANCSSHGTPFYGRLAETVPKMRISVNSSHNGQPSAGGGRSGQVGLAFQKVFLEGDTRWRPLLVGTMSEATNIK